MSYGKAFRVNPGEKVKLREIDPNDTPGAASHEAAKADTDAHAARLRVLQERLYAEHKRSLLICLQAMDAGGKDGTINHVLGAMNPQGCRVVSFKQPSSQERDHDFLWRVHAHAPGKGEVAVFNRSHYEDVLVPRVHKLIPKASWEERYEQINAFEKLLSENGTTVLKFFLHISKDEQLARFKARLDDPSKWWKISETDYTERTRWDDYTAAFEGMMEACSTRDAPWYVIPSNHKWFRNLAVSQIVADRLEKLDPEPPPPSVDIEQIRKAYHAAKGGD